MLRYIALARVEESSEARAVYGRALEVAIAPESGLTQGYRTEALCFLYIDTTPGRMRVHPLGHEGVVVGTLFRNANGASSPVTSLCNREVGEIHASRGGSLVHRHWGQYIALIEGCDGSVRIIRDPTGGLPCHYVRSSGVVFIFSHLNDCAPVLPIKLSLNYSHLHAFLHLQRFIPSDTGFNEVQAVHSGEAVDFSDRCITRTFLWRPASFCVSPAEHEDIAESILSLRNAVTRCVHGWAACRRSVLHELSGGLDSSIVLATLVSAPDAPKLTCCTHVTESSEGDERYYARLMADHVRVPLVELPVRPMRWNRIEELVQVRDPISPLFTSFQCGADSETKELIETGSFGCTFSGQGGDQLFHRILPAIEAADYAWVHRLSSRLLTAMLDAAQISKQPLWRIAREAIKYGYLRRPYDVWRESQVAGFIRAPPIDPSRSCHPWLVEANIPPAKLLQLMCLTETQTYFATPRPYVDEIHPLVSQPVLECCLQIPTYILSHGGTDRTIARAAFRNELPPEIAERSSKGAVNRFFYDAIYGNREHIRPFLLDGLLADRGLLDRFELERSLDDPSTIARGRRLIPIMTATICEMWLRRATSFAQATGLSAAA